ncbi:membrane protein YdbS with pleckstrin-like domain [Catenisphaera adipataccumulans]|uniref:Membrane protein YdbS with pleckstrin-like domain n=1 Tax=Catenisphaera adipataccumulans TaxID=700500 RepID=A0A7W8CXT8_9FIRM|nr:hypothetical protein [Catenisphaera adipataccumulans]MBB5182418.1 membrane protein YdbS with pleckstrin-like domain [Catenisphaera adipataccumulans]
MDIRVICSSDIAADTDEKSFDVLCYGTAAADFLCHFKTFKQNKEDPLTTLGILFSVNQMLYLLIAMWIYPTIPEKMLMVIAMIFGAHLMPYSWLYRSKSYFAFSIIIPITALIVGLIYEPFILAAVMIIFEAIFSLFLLHEVKSRNHFQKSLSPIISFRPFVTNIAVKSKIM